jgi:hypothetical protein
MASAAGVVRRRQLLAAGNGALRRQRASPMGGEGSGWASQICKVVAYIKVGSGMGGGGLLLGAGPRSLP